MERYLKRAMLGVLALACSVAGSAWSGDYPTKPIRLVIPYPPGGSADVVARILGHEMTKGLGRQVILDNRGGATGIIAAQMVGRAAPDRYTLMLACVGPNAINPSIYKELPYDPIADFAPITLAMVVPQIVVVNPALNATSLQQLMAIAKAKPGVISYASPGTGSSIHLSQELFKSLAGINMTHVPYKGAGPALNDVVAGHVQFMFPSAPSGMPLVKSARLRALAVTTSQRVSALFNIPTIAESGVPGYEAVTWFGLVAPAGTAPQLIDKLNKEVGRVLKVPEVKERLAGIGAEIKAARLRNSIRI